MCAAKLEEHYQTSSFNGQFKKDETDCSMHNVKLCVNLEWLQLSQHHMVMLKLEGSVRSFSSSWGIPVQIYKVSHERNQAFHLSVQLIKLNSRSHRCYW